MNSISSYCHIEKVIKGVSAPLHGTGAGWVTAAEPRAGVMEM
ncbi:hypothetical protein [Desulforhabdus sp. TSK]|nr:hypothetical protein [Desulforhabdus sp. TSK]